MIGASIDSADANRKWARKYDLKMPLIGDVGDHDVANAFGVSRPTGRGGQARTTWLIDPDGTLRRMYPKVTPKGHAAEVLAACKELWG